MLAHEEPSGFVWDISDWSLQLAAVYTLTGLVWKLVNLWTDESKYAKCDKIDEEPASSSPRSFHFCKRFQDGVCFRVKEILVYFSIMVFSSSCDLERGPSTSLSHFVRNRHRLRRTHQSRGGSCVALI